VSSLSSAFSADSLTLCTLGPLLYPAPTGQTCDHEQFRKEKGCVKDIDSEAGGLMRVTLDRESPLYKVIYNQRTSCERINFWPVLSPLKLVFRMLPDFSTGALVLQRDFLG